MRIYWIPQECVFNVVLQFSFHLTKFNIEYFRKNEKVQFLPWEVLKDIYLMIFLEMLSG